jgi:hypothetical protein
MTHGKMMMDRKRSFEEYEFERWQKAQDSLRK